MIKVTIISSWNSTYNLSVEVNDNIDLSSIKNPLIELEHIYSTWINRATISTITIINNEIVINEKF